jgi:hypothetical protein
VSVQPRALAQPLGRLWLRYIISTREQMMSRLKTALESPSDATPEAPRRAGSRRRL